MGPCELCGAQIQSVRWKRIKRPSCEPARSAASSRDNFVRAGADLPVHITSPDSARRGHLRHTHHNALEQLYSVRPLHAHLW